MLGFTKFKINRLVNRRELYSNFSYNKWNQLDTGSKWKCLQQLENHFAAEQGRPAVKVLPISSKEARGAYGGYDPDKNVIYINRDLVEYGTLVGPVDINHPTQLDANMQLFDTIAHEGYHAYQGYAIKHPGFHKDMKQVKEWAINDRNVKYFRRGDEYLVQPRERDAWKYGSEKTREAFDEIEKYYGTEPGRAMYEKVSYAGDYLQVAKDSDDYTKNYYGVIYQINAHIQPDGGQRKDVVSYYSMKFENVIVGGDGKCEIDLDEYDVPYDDFSVEVTSGDLSSGSYSFDGYQTLEELKKNYVDEVADEFDCEWDVSGKLEAVDLGVTSDYLCSYSSDRLLTDSDVEGYLNANYSEYNFPEGINIIQMIINEIYAKHGYEFTDSKLSAYFSNKTWYKSNTNKVNDMNAVSDSMSEIEKKNVDFLNSYR